MTSNSIKLVEEFSKFLGEKPYFTKKQLINVGLFGSVTALDKALKRGTLPSLKVSTKRTVIPRSSVIEYFSKNLVESARGE